MEDQVESEIASSHRFFCEWFAGVHPRSEAHLARHFVGRLDPGFQLIDPSGDVIDVERLGHLLWAGYGTAANLVLSADNIRVRGGDNKIIIASYHEWQRNSSRYERADNGRMATAVFRVDATAANGLRWVHVHETWLPERAVAAWSEGRREGRVARSRRI